MEEENQESAENQSEEINENLGNIISSYSKEPNKEELETVFENIQNRIAEIKKEDLPPVESDIDQVNKDIDRTRLKLEKVKNQAVLVDDFSDDTEFHYSDKNVKSVEDEIKTLLNKRYGREKSKFRLIEEVDVLEDRYIVCEKLLESYNLKDDVNELYNRSDEFNENFYFDLDDYSSIDNIADESMTAWEANWDAIITYIGYSNSFKEDLKKNYEYFDSVKEQLEERDFEYKYVYKELSVFSDIEELLDEVVSSQEENLFSSTSSLYELVADYEVDENYNPANKSRILLIINGLKSLIINIRVSLDRYKLDYKDFRKSINNMFTLLNKSLKSIENQQKAMKTMQVTRTKKLKDIITLISKSSVDSLRNNSSEIENIITNLEKYGAPPAQIDALHFYYSIKANYPSDEDTREDLVEELNEVIDLFNFREIDWLCQIIEIKYEKRKGFYIDQPMDSQVNNNESPKPKLNKVSLKPVKKANLNGVESKSDNSKSSGNLDFLAHMYFKEAQKSEGEKSVKAYLKALEAFLKCAEGESSRGKKVNLLKYALKSAKEAMNQVKSSETVYSYALAYRELAYNHSAKISPQGHIKIGDNFVNAGKTFITEEKEDHAKQCFYYAIEAYKKGPDNDSLLKSKVRSVETKYLK